MIESLGNAYLIFCFFQVHYIFNYSVEKVMLGRLTCLWTEIFVLVVSLLVLQCYFLNLTLSSNQWKIWFLLVWICRSAWLFDSFYSCTLLRVELLLTCASNFIYAVGCRQLMATATFATKNWYSVWVCNGISFTHLAVDSRPYCCYCCYCSSYDVI